jgi:hypothetical protein
VPCNDLSHYQIGKVLIVKKLDTNVELQSIPKKKRFKFLVLVFKVKLILEKELFFGLLPIDKIFFIYCEAFVYDDFAIIFKII